MIAYRRLGDDKKFHCSESLFLLSLKKVSEQIVSVFRQNRLRMKLYTFDIERFMANAHDFFDCAAVVPSPGGYFQAIR